MEKYKVVGHHINQRGLTVFLRGGGTVVSVVMPDEYKKYLPAGKIVWAHKNKQDHIVAYSFGGWLYFLRRPAHSGTQVEFLQNFRGLSNLSMDRIFFEIALARAVLVNGGRPTLSAPRNFALLDHLEQRVR